MEKITLDAELRGVGRHPVRELRDVARVPAVIYGAGHEAKPISVNAKALQKALHQAGSGLLTLQIVGDSPLNVLPREVQRHPVRHNVLHVDFQAVSMTEKLRLHVPIIHEGDAPAMKLNGDLVLVRSLDSIEIECLPADIPNALVADLTGDGQPDLLRESFDLAHRRPQHLAGAEVREHGDVALPIVAGDFHRRRGAEHFAA